MYQVTWLDREGKANQLEFASWKFADAMAKQLTREGNRRVRLVPVRRDVYKINLQTFITWKIATNKLLSEVNAEINDAVFEDPNVSLLITPPQKEKKTG